MAQKRWWSLTIKTRTYLQFNSAQVLSKETDHETANHIPFVGCIRADMQHSEKNWLAGAVVVKQRYHSVFAFFFSFLQQLIEIVHVGSFPELIGSIFGIKLSVVLGTFLGI